MVALSGQLSAVSKTFRKMRVTTVYRRGIAEEFGKDLGKEFENEFGKEFEKEFETTNEVCVSEKLVLPCFCFS